MIFLAPWLLIALPALPILWWLLRATPPAPRTESFPAIRLLADLRPIEETPARTPWWLLVLRLLAAGLIIVGLAQPVLTSSSGLPVGSGPLLLVVDDGWAAAADWPNRMAAAMAAIDSADRAGRRVIVMTTARDEADAAPTASPASPAAEQRARIAALRPKPWPVDREAAAAALAKITAERVIYVSDGVFAPNEDQFARALAAAGPVTEMRNAVSPVRLMLPPRAEADGLVARLSLLPSPIDTAAAILAQSGDGRSLSRATAPVPAGATNVEVTLPLPPELRNRLARLVLEGPSSAGSVALLDERWRRRPVGLLTAESGGETPLIGPLYYLRRALSPFTELRQGDLKTLLSRDISVLILADRPVDAGEDEAMLTSWVEKGGLLIRFAGPRLAEQVDEPLLPVKLLSGDRQLGGALSWSEPAAIAPLSTGPFDGLTVPSEVTVTRQVLAEPSADLASHTWARLADGTPLVTEAPRGAGRIVLFHVTANADWSNLPLSGLFVDMLRRLVQLASGVATTDDATILAPAETLDASGVLGPPPQAARGLPARAFATTPVSPQHPPGVYGPENGRQALNLAVGQPELAASAVVPGAVVETLTAVGRDRAIGPPMIAVAVALLAIDLFVTLILRGNLALRRRAVAGLVLAAGFVVHPALAEPPPPTGTRLAFVASGDAQMDSVSKSGLAGLSDYVNRRTAANLAEPASVTPGHDDLSFYPLIYWPIAPSTEMSAEGIAALNAFMAHGGIVVIDTRGGGEGSGSGFSPGADAALRRAARGLDVPALAPLTTEHVLARSFYLLNDFPGRFAGSTVWVQRDQDRTNDSVSPVIIGSNDWASAWAVDSAGHNPYATIPGGARQRVLAYRFGVNLVMYALTGNYKGDLVHVPAILERLGQ